MLRLKQNENTEALVCIALASIAMLCFRFLAHVSRNNEDIYLRSGFVCCHWLDLLVEVQEKAEENQ